MKDGYILHFLKQFPAWIVLSCFSVFVILCWLFLIVYHPDREKQIDFLGTIINLMVGGLLGILTGRYLPQLFDHQPTQINVSEGQQTVNSPISESGQRAQPLEDIQPDEVDGLINNFNEEKSEEK